MDTDEHRSVAPFQLIDFRYKLEELLGEGAHGLVYRAWDIQTGSYVALKILKKDVPQELRMRIVREAHALERLHHLHVVGFLDAVCTDALSYIAMEYLDGRDLGDLKLGLSPVMTARLLRQAARGVNALHDAGVIHRDLKPGNLMLIHEDERLILKICDLGLAKIEGAERMTVDGIVFGTPLYMAPEQVLSPATIGRSADIYALGCIAYYFLTGRPPFVKPDLLSMLTAHQVERPEPLSKVRGGVPRELEDIIMRCLAKNPQERPTAKQLVEALSPFEEDAEEQRETEVMPQPTASLSTPDAPLSEYEIPMVKPGKLPFIVAGATLLAAAIVTYIALLHAPFAP
jgi:serine/threonine-protein kinase